MASKWEILEYLRIRGGWCYMSELYKIFGNGFVSRDVNLLASEGFVKVQKVYKPGTRILVNKIELTKTAYNLLKRNNVESFYDLPAAKLKEKWLMEVRGRTFKRFDNV